MRNRGSFPAPCRLAAILGQPQGVVAPSDGALSRAAPQPRTAIFTIHNNIRYSYNNIHYSVAPSAFREPPRNLARAGECNNIHCSPTILLPLLPPAHSSAPRLPSLVARESPPAGTEQGGCRLSLSPSLPLSLSPPCPLPPTPSLHASLALFLPLATHLPSLTVRQPARSRAAAAIVHRQQPSFTRQPSAAGHGEALACACTNLHLLFALFEFAQFRDVLSKLAMA